MPNYNRNSTFDVLSQHRIVFFNLFETSSGTATNQFNEMHFSKIIRDYIADKGIDDNTKDKILQAFSMKNLSEQGIVVINNDTNTFTFMEIFYNLFSYLNEDRYYKLNNYSLVKFRNSINNMKKDFDDISLKDEYETKDFIDMLMDEFSLIRQELEKHVRILDGRVNKLITTIENSSNEIGFNTYSLSKEILEINNYFIQPLIEFLKTDSSIDKRKKSQGIATSIKKIRDKLSANGYSEESVEVTSFLLNFQKSYMEKANEMGNILSRYVKKSIDDIRVHSNIEKLYSFLEEKIMEASHGKKSNKYLKSTDLIDKIPFLADLKLKENFSSVIDYEQELIIADISWDNFNEKMKVIEGKKEKILTHFNELTDHEKELMANDAFVANGNKVLSEMKREILDSGLSIDDDIFVVCHNKLKNSLDNYKLFHSVILVYSLENELDYEIDFNTKRYIKYGGEKITYFKKRIGAI